MPDLSPLLAEAPPVCEHCKLLIFPVRRDAAGYPLEAEPIRTPKGDRYHSSCIEAADLYKCGFCNEWHDPEDSQKTRVRHWDFVCEECYDQSFNTCSGCEEHFHRDDLSFHEGSQQDYCASCMPHGSNCEAPHQEFTFPTLGMGDGFVSSDTRLTVELPKGIIDDNGLQAITNYLYVHNNPAFFALSRVQFFPTNDVSWEKWQTHEGNFTKRLSKALLKSQLHLPAEERVKLTPNDLALIGDIARQHTSDLGSVNIEFTRNLNLPAEDFYHSDSCWWGGYDHSRCLLKQHGGMGLRSFSSSPNSYTGQYVTGRVWVQPYMVEDESFFTPTGDCMGENVVFAVYNGYGDSLETRQWARIVAQLTGHSYKKVTFSFGNAYINDESCYLVGPQDLLNKTHEIYTQVFKECGC